VSSRPRWPPWPRGSRRTPPASPTGPAALRRPIGEPRVAGSAPRASRRVDGHGSQPRAGATARTDGGRDGPLPSLRRQVSRTHGEAAQLPDLPAAERAAGSCGTHDLHSPRDFGSCWLQRFPCNRGRHVLHRQSMFGFFPGLSLDIESVSRVRAIEGVRSLYDPGEWPKTVKRPIEPGNPLFMGCYVDKRQWSPLGT
jgi:hypothetical protein